MHFSHQQHKKLRVDKSIGRREKITLKARALFFFCSLSFFSAKGYFLGPLETRELKAKDDLREASFLVPSFFSQDVIVYSDLPNKRTGTITEF